MGYTPDFQDVLVQFVALRLIVQSDRRRAVSDTNTYWTLTQLEKTHLMQLRARRRPSNPNSPEAKKAGAKKASEARQSSEARKSSEAKETSVT
jgi:DNA topoisomerase IA